ncbi:MULTISPECIES: sensor histidine kinase [Paenibacillus]|uniref:sensor histidine kinase n=1 Tax=Paenibacillus TaxID=44249 RepID=UPI0022B9396F|nr:histidine kinase [Paenibacillus caseinilyticus]MCZ8518448.1 histidine kinase [Paenibacillus caseinilyticus]
MLRYLFGRREPARAGIRCRNNREGEGDAVKNNTSLQMRMVAAFALVLTPLIIFLYYITLYSMDVVRVQVAQSNQNLLSTYVRQMDQSISGITNYLYKQVLSDTDLKTVGIYEYGSEAYDLSQVALSKKMYVELNNHPVAGAFFVYDSDADNFIVSYRDKNLQGELEAIKAYMKGGAASASWNVVTSEGAHALLKAVSFDGKVYLGAWVPLSALTQSIKPFNFGREGEIFLLSGAGAPLTATTLAPGDTAALQQMLGDRQEPYRILADSREGGGSRLTLWMKLGETDLHLVISIPETNVLLQLPFYKKVIYLIPLLCIAVLSVYYFILRRLLLLPMNRLLGGMRRIVHGDLSVQVKEEPAGEFSYLIRTFNRMGAEIRDLTIDRYEERLKVQRAEYKYLQAQINPHFYLNTLNIMYNSAVLQEYETVKTLALHLAEFFRYRIRKNTDEVPIREEIAFIEGYLAIQKVRFPETLTYRIDVESGYGSLTIPPLAIQTLVENCMVHGFKGEVERLHLDIRVKPSEEGPEGYADIVVTDNGRGFPVEKLERMNSCGYFTDLTDSDSHIGLWNVYHRLKMKYGDRASLQFRCGEPRGAEVIIRIPAGPRGIGEEAERIPDRGEEEQPCILY